MKQDSSYAISYPAIHPGTETTSIIFYEGTPDIQKIFPINNDAEAPRRIFVTDTTIAELPAVQPFIEQFADNARGNDAIVILGAGEKYKTIESVLQIVKTALEHDFNRRDIFTGIGGGVITDMTAFAASIFKRGAKAEFVPTTLLGMVDAAVGGKSGCDFESYKNMIGAFYPAQKLYVFPEFIQSLSETQYRSGFAEAFKTALLYSPEMYNLIKNQKEKIIKRDAATLFTIITECVKAKAKIVEEDFTEKNIRMQLNFGHTFAHALESTAGLGKVTHGDAVAWGIGRALAVSENLQLCSSDYKNDVLNLLASFGWETGAVHSSLKNIDNSAQKILFAMKKDKKNSSTAVRLILQKGLADTVITEVCDNDILNVLNCIY